MIDKGFEKLFDVSDQLDTAEPSKLVSPKVADSNYGGSIQFGSDVDRDSQAVTRNNGAQLDRNTSIEVGKSILPELYEKPLRQQIEESRSYSVKPQKKKSYVGVDSKLADNDEKLKVEENIQS